jgi:hypothetical protein
MERLLPCLLLASPSPNSHLRYIRSDCRILSIEMLASQLENADDKQPSVQLAKENLSIEQEIECPRCHDVMTLHSEFDRLGYLCEECDFSLHLYH